MPATAVAPSPSVPDTSTAATPVARAAAKTAAAVLAGVAGFQVALVLGAPWGELTQGGAHAGVLPGGARVIAGASAILLLAMAGTQLAAIDVGPVSRVPAKAVTAGLWFTTVYSGLGIALNLASPSLPEKALWAPVTAVLLGLSAITLRSWRRRRWLSRR